MEYDVCLEQRDRRPLAVVCRRARAQDFPRVVPEACGLVWSVLRAQHIPGAGRHVAVYLDDAVSLEVGVELEAPFAGSGEVIGSATPAGRVATTMHFGAYHLLYAGHEAIRAWCREHGHALAGARWEIYGHWEDAWNDAPGKIVTEISYLLRDPS